MHLSDATGIFENVIEKKMSIEEMHKLSKDSADTDFIRRIIKRFRELGLKAKYTHSDVTNLGTKNPNFIINNIAPITVDNYRITYDLFKIRRDQSVAYELMKRAIEDGIDLPTDYKSIDDFVKDFTIRFNKKLHPLANVGIFEKKSEQYSYDFIEISPFTSNPECFILQGQIDRDSAITYGIYIRGIYVGDEFMEFYKGPNYVEGAKSKNYSQHFKAAEIPNIWKKVWTDLKEIAQRDYPMYFSQKLVKTSDKTGILEA